MKGFIFTEITFYDVDFVATEQNQTETSSTHTQTHTHLVKKYLCVYARSRHVYDDDDDDDGGRVLQECDVKLIPGNLYVMHGHNLYCQTHYHGDRSVPLSHDLQPDANQREGERYVFYVTNILESWIPCSCIC